MHASAQNGPKLTFSEHFQAIEHYEDYFVRSFLTGYATV